MSINNSYGISNSYGVFNSHGVDCEIFCANKKRVFKVFGIEVNEARFNEVMSGIKSAMDGWFPKFNNAYDLYIQSDSDWSKVKVSDIKSTLEDDSKPYKPYKAWKDIPKAGLEYIKSLPEFNAEIFKAVTGIDVEKKEEPTVIIGGITYLVSDVENALKDIKSV